ncbi:CocE/NonD family hydrolase [Actinoplanes oblitus]|uniref:CocE/NonD family hydrolase n=1 Tax=Actinoplanes oblitus TaxID=3040509 RepID=A0ABY8WLP2_9ACTN|nr:CocE/NonD family hydrolase [Actinoplanes oblitus]WIM98342.1 CocE/NonD family hydrolase [Actinoplanes oblitus]
MSGLILAVVVLAAPAEAAGTTGFQAVDISGSGGVTLKANWIAPAGPGRHPVIVFPSSWGLNDVEYIAQAKILAGRGYVVVSYTPRGWWFSGGTIDTAGPLDLADLSKVLDWTIANTPADPARIGAAGISYGAGISLLGAGADPRIRAVAALSGWSDLVYSLYSGDTRHQQSAGLLSLAAQLVGKPSPELTRMLGDFSGNRNVEQVKDWGRIRSAGTYLAAINANQPAVLLANGWGDSFFPPNQLVDFFGGLTTPKRLELRPGDHAIAELTGVLGLPNDAWRSLSEWFDHYLAGQSNGVESEPAVQVKPLNAAAESYPDWSALTGTNRRYGLGRIRLLDGTGLLGGAVSGGWSKRLPADKDTVAGGGVVLLTNGASAITGEQPSIWLPFVDRGRAGVWAAERPSAVQHLRGVPKVHLELSGAARTGTLVTYLYDLDALGNAKLITHAPVSWLDATSSVDVDLFATAYDLPAGHSLTLVVDTTDPLYYDENAPGDSITVTGGSYLDVPLG